jgi:hypothetical protein
MIEDFEIAVIFSCGHNDFRRAMNEEDAKEHRRSASSMLCFECQKEWHRKHRHHHHATPTRIRFTEITMLDTVGGNTLVYTGALPAGEEFPAGTTFIVTSNDPAVVPTVDATGLIVEIPLPTGWVESTTTPLVIDWASDTFVPNPSTSPSSLTASITPSAPPPPPPPPPALTPTSIVFTQTT